jgi:hypothetical protein
MIEAIVRRKIAREGTNAHDRAEDLLTSTAFGLLDHLSADQGFFPLLKRAWRIPATAEEGAPIPRSGIGVPVNAAECRVTFWPNFRAHGEPDLLLELLSADGAVQSVVLIEAKLFSPMSGTASETDGPIAIENVPDPDQLVKYWQGLALHTRLGGLPRALVYLTSHSTPPLHELRVSLGRDPRINLYWLSWRDVWEVAEAKAATHRAAADLERLLRHLGFSTFKGFRAQLGLSPGSGFFWPWFTQHPIQLGAQSGQFWRST